MEYYSSIRVIIMKNIIAWESTSFMLKERCKIQNVIKYVEKYKKNYVPKW